MTTRTISAKLCSRGRRPVSQMTEWSTGNHEKQALLQDTHGYAYSESKSGGPFPASSCSEPYGEIMPPKDTPATVISAFVTSMRPLFCCFPFDRQPRESTNAVGPERDVDTRVFNADTSLFATIPGIPAERGFEPRGFVRLEERIGTNTLQTLQYALQDLGVIAERLHHVDDDFQQGLWERKLQASNRSIDVDDSDEDFERRFLGRRKMLLDEWNTLADRARKLEQQCLEQGLDVQTLLMPRYPDCQLHAS